jgi:hypothetical protein
LAGTARQSTAHRARADESHEADDLVGAMLKIPIEVRTTIDAGRETGVVDG